MRKIYFILMALLMSAGFAFAADPSNPDLLAQGFDDNNGSGATYDAATQTITFNGAWSGMRWTFYGVGDKLVEYQTCTIEFEPVDFYMELIIADWDNGGVGETVGIDTGKSTATVAIQPATQIMIQGGEGATSVKLISAKLEKAGGEVPDFVTTGKVLLSQFDGFADDAIVTITISVTNEGGWGPGWGVGRITDIAFAKDETAWATMGIDVKESSAEGSLNAYEYTVGQLKAMASIPPAELEALKAASEKEYGTEWTVNGENYIVNEAGEIGVAVNIWGTGTRVSVTVKDAPTPPPTFVLDFESDEIGTAYPVISLNAPDQITATVAARPGGGGQALHVINLNWDTYPQFFVAFPAGKTLADVEKITFELYFESVEAVGGQIPNSYKGFRYFFGEKGTAFTTAGKETGDLIQSPASNPGQTWLKKEFVPVIEGENLLSLNEFEFGFGLHINDAGNYFFDNITFVLKEELGIIQVKPVVPNAYGIAGGIVVNAVNEKVSIYGIDGRLVKQVATANNQTIDLAKGLYIVKVGTAKAVKVAVR